MDLITDRTQADVIDDTAKGNYDSSDRNRVGEAVSVIAELLRAFDYTVAVDPKTDWAEDDYPTETLMAAYLADIVALESVYETIPSHKQLDALPADLRLMTYTTANSIEKNLSTINDLASNLRRSFDRCNEIYIGE